MPLLQRSAHTELVTRVREAPRPEAREAPPLDVDLSWLLAHLAPDLTVRFAIKRTDATCRTPRRNQQVEAALRSAAALHKWATSVHNHFVDVFKRAAPAVASGRAHNLDLTAISEQASALFVPVLPLLQPPAPTAANRTAPSGAASAPPQAGTSAGASGGGASSVPASVCAAPLLPSIADVHALLAEQRRTTRRRRVARGALPEQRGGECTRFVSGGQAVYDVSAPA